MSLYVAWAHLLNILFKEVLCKLCNVITPPPLA